MSGQILAKLEELIKNECAKYTGLPVAVSGGIDSAILAKFIEPEYIISVDLPGGDKYNEIEYAKLVAKTLDTKHIIIKLDHNDFEKSVRESVLSIGRPIPHFNIFPLYKMYEMLSMRGEKDLILGDGPDESMAGYVRHLIFDYLYKAFEVFPNHKEMILKGFNIPHAGDAYSKVIGKEVVFDDQLSLINNMCRTDINLMRPDMDDMSNGIAKIFGIKNIRPHQDNLELDNFMFNLPEELKIAGGHGKYALRLIADKYFPKKIAWKPKVGGPVYPVNLLMGWDKECGEFGKSRWLDYQQEILKSAA